MLTAREKGLVLRVKAWLAKQCVALGSCSELPLVAEACVKAGLETPNDWDQLHVNEVEHFHWLKHETRQELKGIAEAATEQGNLRRKAQATPPARLPNKRPLADRLPKGNAVVAVVKLKASAKTCAATPFALGAKQGAELLGQALDRGLDGEEWAKQALRDVVAGSAKGSLASAQSALRCWAAFSDYVLGASGNHLPPTAEGLACWSRLFRNANTFSNYVGYLRLGCHVLGLDTCSSYGPMVQRAKQEIKARQGPPRKKRFIQEATVVALMEHAMHENSNTMAMLFLAAYAFMLRVPSELLPATSGANGDADLPLVAGAHSCFSVCGEDVVLRLAKRKNRAHGSTLRRGCWCSSKADTTCPVHVLGPWLDSLPPGSKPFSGITAVAARRDLKRRLRCLKVKAADTYWLHDLRRGHAQDMVDNGGRLCEILKAGEWSSPAFTAYLDLDAVEQAGILEAHLDESEDEVEAALEPKLLCDQQLNE